MIASGEERSSKRITIELPVQFIDYFDQLKREWGLRSSGDVIKRLLEERPLIPKDENETSDLFEDMDSLDKEIDYNHLVVRFSGNHTYISHSSIDKIKSIKYQLVLLGIIDSTIESAVRNGKKVYT